MNTAISIKDLSKTYKSKGNEYKLAVNQISLECLAGETFGFIGPNGAGKSTTIKILTGVIRQDSGTAHIFGNDIRNPESRRGVGYVPENPYLSDYLTPYDVLSTSLELHKCKPQNKTAHIMSWLEKLEIAHVARKEIRSFSKGMTQRVALAQAMCIEPKLLILDEPLSGLDPVGRRDVVNLLAEYKKNGALFFTSHVLHDVERLADRFGLIDQGEIRTIKSPHELFTNENHLTVEYTGKNSILGSTQLGVDRYSIDTSQADLWKIIESLKNGHCQILSIKSNINLEKAFFKLIHKDQNIIKQSN